MNYKTSCQLILFIAAALILTKFCQKQTDGFSILAISSNRPYNPSWESRPLLDQEKGEIENALSQPYYYLAWGSQTFVFSSQDDKYVIKFFKQRLFNPSPVLNTIPLPPILHRFREKRNFKRIDKLTRDFASYKMAFEELKEETQLVYVHLNAIPLNKKLKIKDKCGIVHELDLDKFSFIVQKKAEPAYYHICRLMQQGDIQEAKNAIKKVVSLIKTRCEKGFKDRDPDVRTNCGFVGNIAVKLDVGRLEKTDAFQQADTIQAEIEKVTAPFQMWIATFYPILSETFYEVD